MSDERKDRGTWRRLADGTLSWKDFRARAAVIDGIRRFFKEMDFLEVDPPIASPFPNIDPNVYPVRIEDAAGNAAPLFLHTSPEPAMKKLLAAGSGNIFYLGKAFRDREGSPLHSPEFTLLEWYRHGPADRVMRDVEELVRVLAAQINGREAVSRNGREILLDRPWARFELSAAFRELLGAEMTDGESLRAGLVRTGANPGPGESWEDLFFRACIEAVEPEAAKRGACFLTGFPAALGAMARRRESDPAVAERFEGYLAGVELVNGYEELTDPEEQEARLEQLRERHLRVSGQELPADPDFLDALRHGLPPCSGAALGVDRLVMLLLGNDDIADGMYR